MPLEREDFERFARTKQELQLAAEQLFQEMMDDDFDLAAFLANPREYTRAFIGRAVAGALGAVLPDAYAAGKKLEGSGS